MDPPKAGLSFRQLAVVASPMAAAVLLLAGMLLDPDINAEGRELAREYAENPERIQMSALAFHFAFALLAVPAVALIVAVRGKGAGLANTAGVLAVLGMTTLPGFLLTDFYDVAIYGELGGDAWQAVNDRLEELPGATVLFLTGFVGYALALPVALLGAWRAGQMPWWPALVAFAGIAAAQAAPAYVGFPAWAAALIVLGVVLWKWEHRPGMATA